MVQIKAVSDEKCNSDAESKPLHSSQRFTMEVPLAIITYPKKIIFILHLIAILMLLLVLLFTLNFRSISQSASKEGDFRLKLIIANVNSKDSPSDETASMELKLQSGPVSSPLEKLERFEEAPTLKKVFFPLWTSRPYYKILPEDEEENAMSDSGSDLVQGGGTINFDSGSVQSILMRETALIFALQITLIIFYRHT